jgi:uncharacterized FAD-dependent dehydrogenase
VFDTLIVGAGPAGLSAAAECEGRTLLVEQGLAAAARDRRSPRDVLCGVGGAGLFSDGKHSFFPAATALWQLPEVEDAFAATARFLRRYGIEAGELPRAPAPDVASGPKLYPSIYASLADRFRMIDELWRGERRAGAEVVDAGRAGDELVLALRDGEELRARRVIVATGRWSPAWIRPWLEALGARYRHQRVELGVRLELPASAELFARLPGVDGKLRFALPDCEIRTFCTCRDGEVVIGEAHGLRAFSGRADGPPTGASNVGLVVRTTAAHAGEPLALDVGPPRSFALADWAEHAPRVFAPRARALLEIALDRLRAFAPGIEAARVYAPAIEGVGEYPLDDGALRVAPGVHVAGDACGRFRGIVAAMVSGRYAARRSA